MSLVFMLKLISIFWSQNKKILYYLELKKDVLQKSVKVTVHDSKSENVTDKATT